MANKYKRAENTDNKKPRYFGGLGLSSFVGGGGGGGGGLGGGTSDGFLGSEDIFAFSLSTLLTTITRLRLHTY